MNLPVVFADAVIGTVNCLDVRGYYTPERVAKVEGLAPFAAMALIVASVDAVHSPSKDGRPSACLWWGRVRVGSWAAPMRLTCAVRDPLE